MVISLLSTFTKYDEYIVVIQEVYTLIIDGKRISLNSGEEYFIPENTVPTGESTQDTRTIHAFGEKRAKRAGEFQWDTFIDIRRLSS
jgi:hypothetical protein